MGCFADSAEDFYKFEENYLFMQYGRTALMIALLGIICLACKPNSQANVYKSTAFSEDGILAIIEIPAGTSHKIEFNSETAQFENDQIDGQDRIINFLPYPANYGFIPSTYMNPEEGGDGDALDILIIAEAMKTGSKLEVIPIAALDLKDQGEIDTKIIAIPADTTLQIISAKDFRSFAIEYSAAKHIIEQWFLNYKGLSKMEFIGWRNEQVAKAEIKRWLIRERNEKLPLK